MVTTLTVLLSLLSCFVGLVVAFVLRRQSPALKEKGDHGSQVLATSAAGEVQQQRSREDPGAAVAPRAANMATNQLQHGSVAVVEPAAKKKTGKSRKAKRRLSNSNSNSSTGGTVPVSAFSLEPESPPIKAASAPLEAPEPLVLPPALPPPLQNSKSTVAESIASVQQPVPITMKPLSPRSAPFIPSNSSTAEKPSLPAVVKQPVVKLKAWQRVAKQAQELLVSRSKFQKRGMVKQLDLTTFHLIAGATNPPKGVVFQWAAEDLHSFNRLEDPTWTKQFDNLACDHTVFENQRYSKMTDMGGTFALYNSQPDTISDVSSESDFAPSPMSSCPASPVLFKDAQTHSKVKIQSAAAAAAAATLSSKLNRSAGEFCPTPRGSGEFCPTPRSSSGSVKSVSSAPPKKTPKFTMRIMSDLEVVDTPPAAGTTIRILPGSDPNMSKVDLDGYTPMMLGNLNPCSALFMSSGITNYNPGPQQMSF
mmetsp:Transcript_17801/g.25028  ORF Transcript_17801/g.25028 Transcript_17801/m.25028 type:complete len:478 (-) Transcript_17801:471-1904(-)